MIFILHSPITAAALYARSIIFRPARELSVSYFQWRSYYWLFKNLLLFRDHQLEETLVKRLSQGRNNVTEWRVEPVIEVTGRHKNGALNHSTTLPTSILVVLYLLYRKPLNGSFYTTSNIKLYQNHIQLLSHNLKPAICPSKTNEFDTTAIHHSSFWVIRR